jgi:uncharacterized protein (TIGR02001 family)
MKKILAAIVVSMSAVTAQAEITGNASLTSDYRFRGISQSQGASAIQGGIDYTHKSGFYAGNWNSSVSSDVYLQGSGMESDLYAGFRKTLGPVTLDVGAISYFYPNARTGANPDRYNTDEVYVGAAVGVFSARVHQAYSNYFGAANSRDTRYYQIKADVPVIKDVVINAAVGRTDVANQTASDYDDWKVGATITKAGFDFGLHYYGTEKTTDAFKTANTVNGKENFDRGMVLTATKFF